MSGPRVSATRRGATAQLLAVGRRASSGGRDPRGTVQALCLVLAAAGAAVLVWGLQVTHAVYEARDARLSARVPVMAAPDDSRDVLLRWSDPGDTWDGRSLSVVNIEPVEPVVPVVPAAPAAPGAPGASGAPLPPGLPRWPQPGEAYVSPALLAAMPEAATRYGVLAGTIAPDGLADPGELFVYRRPPPGVGMGETAGLGAVGFGAPPERAALFHSQTFDRAEGDLHLLMAPFVGLPVMVLLVVASRLGARERDRRLAILHAIGAGRSVRARIAAGECLRPLAAGTVLAAVPLTIPTLTGLRLPLTGYEIAAADLAPVRWWFPLTLVAVWAALCVLFAALHLRIGGGVAEGNRPRPGRERTPAWPGYVCGLGTLCALWGAMIGFQVGVRLFLVGVVLALAGLPPLLGRAAAGIAGRLTGGRRGRGDAARLLGGRWAASRPGVITRTCAALAVLLGLVAQAHVFVTHLSGPAREAAALARHLDGRLLQVTAAPTGEESVGRFLAALDSGDRVLRIRSDASGKGTVLRGSCEDLAALAPLRACPREAADQPPYVFRQRTPLTEALRWMHFGPVSVQATTSPDELLPGNGPFVILPATADGRERVERAAQAHLALPDVGTPGESFTVGGSANARIGDWAVLVAAIGFVLLALTGVTGLLHAFLDRADALRPLAGYTSGVRFHLRVAWWGMGVPTLCAMVLATLFAGVLAAFSVGFLAPTADSPVPVLAGGLAVAVAVCAAATVAGGLLAARFTHRWVPHGD
ncbi:hypothetical protein [Streptomyces sp. TRM64462]|uniref:hypothetical protein n=1 Tax=Streptomyces sp. TRM64462 TaxID=2741726 RepID=UPI001585D5FA|nr:hypothetical protein [Streptomyces sp. TRM64462]